MSAPQWVVRDEDPEMGTTWVMAGSIKFETSTSCIDRQTIDKDVEAEWTKSSAEAHRFSSELEARLIAMQVGGRARPWIAETVPPFVTAILRVEIRTFGDPALTKRMVADASWSGQLAACLDDAFADVLERKDGEVLRDVKLEEWK